MRSIDKKIKHNDYKKWLSEISDNFNELVSRKNLYVGLNSHADKVGVFIEHHRILDTGLFTPPAWDYKKYVLTGNKILGWITSSEKLRKELIKRHDDIKISKTNQKSAGIWIKPERMAEISEFTLDLIKLTENR